MSLSVQAQVTNILAQRSVISRCNDLTTLISSVSVEELRSCYQSIVENIFGFVGYVGWGLRSTTRQNLPKESEAISKFLAPNGPFIELAYRLMADQNLKYEFPIKCLPISVERLICKGDTPPFLSNKLPAFYSTSQMPTYLLLNAFEYYFCMFAFLQMGSCVESNSYLIGWGNLTDTVYTTLLEEYLTYFLPCNGRGVPNVEFQFRQIPDTSFVSSPTVSRGQYPLTAGSFDKMRPKLFKPLVFQDQLVGTAQREPLFHSAIPSVQKEVWRSETILNMMMLLWFSVDVPADPCSLQFETILPSVDLVKSVRVLVRHFHYFINCVSNHVLHPLDDIKRNTFPLFQKKLYVFLRYLLARWPLDNSFRIVYETWLSYIQPWRYINFDRSVSARDREDVQIDSRWYNFILENILFYTYLFQQMLPRFERVELVAVRNAHMLYRVAKVFSQSESFKKMLKEIERTLQSDGSRSIGSEQYVRSISGSQNSNATAVGASIYLHSPSKVSSTSTSNRTSGGVGLFGNESQTSGITMAQVQHHIRELENPNFTYQPLYSTANRDRVLHLMSLICEAKNTVGELVHKSDDESKAPLSWFDKMFKNETTTTIPKQNATLIADRNKTINFLEQSRIHLSRLFDLPLPDPVESRSETTGTDSLDGSTPGTGQRTVGSYSSFFNRSGSPDISLNPEYLSIFPKGKFNPEMVKPLGNPDLTPLRGDEQRSLVAFLVSFSRCLNRTFLPFIQALYYEDSWKGKYMRAIVARPVYYVEQEKLGPGRVTRVRKYLPPRINLRFMGSNYFSCVMLGVLLIGLLFGVRGYGWIIWPLFGFVLYASMRALSEPRNHLANLLEEFADEQPHS